MNLKPLYRLGKTLLLGTLIMTGCSSPADSSGMRTATSQANRVISLATQMGYQARSTLEAGQLSVTATAQAREATLAEARLWQVVIQDPFDEESDDWAVGEDENEELGSISWSIAGGKYRWSAEAKTGYVWWVAPESEVSDFYLSVEAQQMINPEVGEYGVIFRRADDGHYYLFEISDLGYYALFYYSPGNWESLIDWTSHPSITAGAPNRLAVHASGSQFDLYINDVYVTGYQDDRQPSGSVGLLIGLANEGESAAWEFDNFELRAP